MTYCLIKLNFFVRYRAFISLFIITSSGIVLRCVGIVIHRWRVVIFKRSIRGPNLGIQRSKHRRFPGVYSVVNCCPSSGLVPVLHVSPAHPLGCWPSGSSICVASRILSATQIEDVRTFKLILSCDQSV